MIYIQHGGYIKCPAFWPISGIHAGIVRYLLKITINGGHSTTGRTLGEDGGYSALTCATMNLFFKLLAPLTYHLRSDVGLVLEDAEDLLRRDHDVDNARVAIGTVLDIGLVQQLNLTLIDTETHFFILNIFFICHHCSVVKER